MKSLKAEEYLGKKTVIFFDGMCNLCNGVVQFIIKRDRDDKFMFASLQSAGGQKLLGGLSTTSAPDSIFLYRDGYIYSESTAVLKILGSLSGPWQMMRALLVIPAFLRDAIYRLVARNRYKWFGKRAECMLPTPDLQKKFLDCG